MGYVQNFAKITLYYFIVFFFMSHNAAASGYYGIRDPLPHVPL